VRCPTHSGMKNWSYSKNDENRSNARKEEEILLNQNIQDTHPQKRETPVQMLQAYVLNLLKRAVSAAPFPVRFTFILFKIATWNFKVMTKTFDWLYLPLDFFNILTLFKSLVFLSSKLNAKRTEIWNKLPNLHTTQCFHLIKLQLKVREVFVYVADINTSSYELWPWQKRRNVLI